MKTGILSAVLAAALITASGADASTAKFELNWSSTSGTSTTDDTMKAFGTLEVGVGDGELFGLQDLVSIDVAVTGDTINDFTIDGTENTQFLFGEISADGMFAFLSDFLFANFIDPFVGNGFGCDFDDPELCGSSNFQGGPNYNIVSGRQITPTGVNGNKGTTTYASAGRALASISLTRLFDDPDPGDDGNDTPDMGGGPGNDLSPIPVPASAPLLLGGLAALALWRRRRSA
ncbi:MAG: VPLPA-CTERM sorting domain-containing protein [Pseudomonadota bacterium]